MRRIVAEERAHGVACRPERSEGVREQDVARSHEDEAGGWLEDEGRRRPHVRSARRSYGNKMWLAPTRPRRGFASRMRSAAAFTSRFPDVSSNGRYPTYR